MEKIFLFFESVLFTKEGTIREGVSRVFDFLTKEGDFIYTFLNSEEKGNIVKNSFQGNGDIFVFSEKGTHEGVMKKMRDERTKESWKKKTVFPVGSKMGNELLPAVRAGFIDLIHITGDESERNTKNPFGIYRILVSRDIEDIVRNYRILH